MPGEWIEILVKQGDLSLGRFTLSSGEYLIGRDGACHINLDLEEVSPAHAKLVITEDSLHIEDMGSGSGTTVSGKRVNRRMKLDVPGQVELGSAILEIVPVDGARASTARMSEAAGKGAGRLEQSLKGPRYEVGYTISHGSMGAIHGARDVNLGRTVAMKVMLGDQATNRASLRRFMREARVMGQLDHPNIAPVHELAVDDNSRVYYTMKYVRGMTLKGVLGKIESGDTRIIEEYPLAKLLEAFQKVCDAIAFAHSKGVIHRDLKPENIMIGEFGEVYVMDWGLAKLLDEPDLDGGAGVVAATEGEEDLSGTAAGDILGTPLYMAPEQAAGRNDELNERTDVFALGGILYSILTLKAPITASNMDELLRKVEMGFIVPPLFYTRTLFSRLVPVLSNWSDFARRHKSVGRFVRVDLAHCPGGAVPEALSNVAMKALSRKPADRHWNVTELQQEIAEYQAGVAGALKRHRWLVSTLGFVIAVLLGFLLNQLVS